MKIVHIDVIIQCYERHTIAKQAFLSWIAETRDAQWKSTIEIKQRYPSVDFLPNNRMVFNIKGKKYRLVVQINFRTAVVNIRFAGTHAEYDKIDAVKI